MVVVHEPEDTPCDDCGVARAQSPFRFCENCMRVRQLAEILSDPAGVAITVFQRRDGELTARIEGKGRSLYLPAAPLLSLQLLKALTSTAQVRELLCAKD